MNTRNTRIMMISTHGYVAGAPPLGRADTGGQVVYVLELSRKLAVMGCRVDVWTRQFEDQAATEDLGGGLRVMRAPCGGVEFIPKEKLAPHLPEWVAAALARMETEELGYDLIISHYWDAGVAGAALAAQLGIPHYHVPHSLGAWKRRQMHEDFPGTGPELDRTYNFAERISSERMVYQSSTAVVATTPAQLEILRAEYDVDFDRVLIWPAGYDDNRFYPVGDASRDLLRARFGFQRRTVLSLGRLARNKGYDLLVRAFAVCARRIPDAELVIAAGGESRNPAEAAMLAELKSEISACGVEDRVRLLDYVPDEELADLYRAADLFAMPSRYEPFGMTAIEAMACGTPTVATIHGGLFRLLHFGVDSLFADPFDAEDFGITMVKPLRHPKLWDRMAHNGATLARTLFTWSGVAQQVLNAVRSPSHFGRGLRVQEDSVGRSPEPSAEREAGE